MKSNTGIKKVAVIGAGLMGHGIGVDFALGGYDTWYYNRQERTSERAMKRARLALDRFVEAGLVTKADADRAYGRLHPTIDMEKAAEGAGYVCESVTEALSLKREIFAFLDKVCPSQAVLTSNTSSFTITSIVEKNDVKYPERCCVAHYFQPPHFLPLVEVVKGKHTSETVLDKTCEILSGIGKKPVRIPKELEGHAGNRIQYAMGREIRELVDQGVCTPEMIDEIIMYSFGRRMANTGWFKRMDLISLDFSYNIAKDAGLEPWGPVKKLVEQGHLGMKSGKGFYEWPDKGEALQRKQDLTLIEYLK
ncbi:MAG: 3-hydroxyacyl-CoA dehydrogenase family protein, partial [Spirochaetales bacterium]|nr:3-hydroxyacyl-CoA dehydrogenase family protein [Spirochaetales bacterium]